MSTMTYKGYAAQFEFSEDDACLVGHISGISDIVGFHGDSVEELQVAFEEAVDDYLETCEALNREPAKPLQMGIPSEPQVVQPLAQGAVPGNYSQILSDLAKVQTSGIWSALPDLQRQLNLSAESSLAAFYQAYDDLNKSYAMAADRLHSRWDKYLQVTSISQLERVTQLGIHSAFEISRNLEIGTRLAISDDMCKSVATTHLDFSKSYVDFLATLNDSMVEAVQLQPAWLTLPPVEHYNASRLMVEVFPPKGIDEVFEDTSVDESENIELTSEPEYAIENLLTELDERLITPWQGAADAVLSGNADRIRHAATSMRELVTSVVHQLAPDSKVGEWTSAPDHFRDGRPTRRARLLYISQIPNQRNFSRFLEKDVDACLGMIDVFQTGVHSLDDSFSDGQMLAFRVRVEGTIRLLIETARS